MSPTNPPLETDPGRIGPYVVERKLGAGGMGTVYLTHHDETNQQAAVKVLSPSLARESGLVARFMREIDAMKKLKSPFVVELYDHGIDGESYYYSMEYVEGETLTARLRREKRIHWREVIDLSIQICTALKAAHDAGIIHRDLKPSNLLLSTDGRIKLTDFGVAQVFAGSKLTITGGIIGTAEYMSPEQAQGKRITKRSDLYSLGAVMYVMLTGRPPFSGKTTLDVLQKHKYSQFDRPQLMVPDIPYWLDEIVCKLMEKDPDKRFADAYVVNRRLQEVARKVDISTSDLTLGEGTARTDASTVAVSSESRRGGSVGPGPGTLMRDLFRAQIEAAKGEHELRKFFENTWVLVGMLLLLIAGIGYWSMSGKISPEQRFEKGVKLLDQDEDANWRTVRDDYFAPLADLKSAEWDEKLEPYKERIALQELKAAMTGRSARRGLRRKTSQESEIGRLITLALHERDDGNLAGAERTLAALSALLANNPKYESKARLVDECLQSLRDRRADPPADFSFVDDALAHADKLAAEGKHAEAVGIWQGVIDLYGHDPQAGTELERAHKGLAGAKADGAKTVALDGKSVAPDTTSRAPRPPEKPNASKAPVANEQKPKNTK